MTYTDYLTILLTVVCMAYMTTFVWRLADTLYIEIPAPLDGALTDPAEGDEVESVGALILRPLFGPDDIALPKAA